MSKNNYTNHSNHLENHDSDNFSKTGYSNSRLNRHIMYTPEPKLHFDAMTIVGNLNKNNAHKLSEFMSIAPQIRLWDILQTKFKAKALQEKVYIEYDKVKADAWDRRNMRVEFNPNKLTHEEMLWLKQNIIDYMEDDGFTRLDLAFDFEDDLSDYYAMTDKSVKKTIFYGRNGKPETKYFGVRDSDRFIRIYNKKQERKDNADIEVMSEHLWRVEIELKRDMVDYWNDCFNDLHILKPDWSSLEKVKDQAMIYMLIHEESTWGKLERRTKNKYREMLKSISEIDLTDLMKLTLKENEKQLQKQIEFWQREFRFWE
ncbi:TPA: replication initiation factor domain-containing protein [Staphylococcus aureus]|uniref:replication initiation factor domain-containing protein n=1 Tax=Staphylococcus sp. GDY8P112P TaxID=2804151 RepID=UPI001AEC468B|nr:replication initiation factor domain-containing protein [Staphylococcus sp. GDY8P112P]HBI1087544.1 replication initiation factor domain-containing protein [Staphylococcus aureus]HBI1087715.1 replication initiation factor domain-containing protein [Staphylococcus aureus]HDE9156614.1 replication initiation factor domain-containing protein [Staphylococcus aureus]HDE9156775.1 replication initiation factor domain-containing protein [Staphylococcus aureus]HDH9581048.1 replication initiation facto